MADIKNPNQQGGYQNDLNKGKATYNQGQQGGMNKGGQQGGFDKSDKGGTQGGQGGNQGGQGGQNR